MLSSLVEKKMKRKIKFVNLLFGWIVSERKEKKRKNKKLKF